MIWVLIALLSGWVISLFVLLVLSGRKIEDLHAVIEINEAVTKNEMQEQVVHILAASNRRYDAVFMRYLANRYESVEEKHGLTMLAKTLEEGQSLPAEWLRRQADELDPPPSEYPEYKFNGEPVL